MRLIFSLLAKLLYLLRLKGYLSPSQLWLHRNYFSVNLSLRDVPSSCTFKISQCVCACVPFFFLLFVHFFSAVNEIPSASWSNGSPMQGIFHIRWTVSPLHHHHIFSSLPRVPLFLYTLQDLSPAQKVQVQVSIFKVLCPRVLLTALHCSLSFNHDLTSLVKTPHSLGK